MTLAQEATVAAMYSTKPDIDWTSEPTDEQLRQLIRYYREADYLVEPEGGLAE